MRGKHQNTGRKRARQARAALGLDSVAPLPDVLAAVEAAGVAVLVTPLPEGFSGAFLKPRDRPVVFLAAGHAVTRQRFTLAHEFGHCFMEHRPGVDRDIDLGSKEPLEIEANWFASEFLVPEDGLADRVDGRVCLQDVVELARPYGVSPPALLYRLGQCDLVDRELADRMWTEIREELHRPLDEACELPGPEDALKACDGGSRVPPDLGPAALARLTRLGHP